MPRDHPADHSGRPLDPTFRGWGREAADLTTGIYTFETIKPGRVLDARGREMAPHVVLWIVARVINIGLSTRMYFGDEEAANAADPVLNLIQWELRRPTLIAARTMRNGKPVDRFDIRLQGDGETVFVDI